MLPNLRSLISAFVIRCFGSIISKLAIGEITILWLIHIAGETGLSLAEDCFFSTLRPNYIHIHMVPIS